MSQRLCFLAAACVVLVQSVSHAAPVEDWDMKRLATEADVIAIGTLTSCTDLSRTDSPRSDPLVRVASKFHVEAVLKGQHTGSLTIIHFRHVTPEELPAGELTGIFNGPRLLVFDTDLKEDVSEPQEEGTAERPASQARYLLFLKRRQDGNYEPVSGQADAIDAAYQLAPLVKERHQKKQREEPK